ncbi:MAG: FAD-dependent oxidoreductase [Desulforhabdus sp.]|jgi:NADPH-dependent 2,4-dienoyl-CoA reductase/sulfur reductase-like enzyme/rhodanese-related sulfurtransferase|nr:FAD-dependent oxidoreductase [Desulforhabdus sp.]
MENQLRVLIIGGVACGPKSASRLKRLIPDADVTMIERGRLVSYGACGLPYYVEGMYPEIRMVSETPVGVLRDAAFFEKAKGFKTLTRLEATRINREAKTVRVKHLDTGDERDVPYDKLVLATGSRPIQPPIPGLELTNVWYMRHPDDAESMVAEIEGQKLGKAVIIGAGYIGVEMAEALVRRGLEVTMVEIFDQIMPQFLDYDMATLAAKQLRQKGVRLVLGEKVLSVQGKEGKVASVQTDKQTVEADLVLVGVGVRPNDELAREAGLACHPRGGIVINGYCQTSDPDIYAGGDCVVNHPANPEIKDAMFVPLGSTSNKHGRLIADHIAGVAEPFVGITGTGVCRAFDVTLGRTGLTEKQARQFYPDVETAIWTGPDLPHYVPQSKPLVIKMVACRRSRKLLGVQVVGMGDASKRLDVAASAIFFGATVDQVGNIDLGYAPPYGPPIDPIAVTAHLLLNKLNGIARGISPLEARRRLESGEDILLLDVRTPDEFQMMRMPYEKQVVHIPLGALRGKLDQLPRDKEIFAFCKVSMRGYEAQRILNAAGFDRVSYIEGGIIGWPFEVWTPA